jgi:hypothetical protein
VSESGGMNLGDVASTRARSGCNAEVWAVDWPGVIERQHPGGELATGLSFCQNPHHKAGDSGYATMARKQRMHSKKRLWGPHARRGLNKRRVGMIESATTRTQWIRMALRTSPTYADANQPSGRNPVCIPKNTTGRKKNC